VIEIHLFDASVVGRGRRTFWSLIARTRRFGKCMIPVGLQEQKARQAKRNYELIKIRILNNCFGFGFGWGIGPFFRGVGSIVRILLLERVFASLSFSPSTVWETDSGGKSCRTSSVHRRCSSDVRKAHICVCVYISPSYTYEHGIT